MHGGSANIEGGCIGPPPQQRERIGLSAIPLNAPAAIEMRANASTP
jgi:hypothetical protein